MVAGAINDAVDLLDGGDKWDVLMLQEGPEVEQRTCRSVGRRQRRKERHQGALVLYFIGDGENRQTKAAFTPVSHRMATLDLRMGSNTLRLVTCASATQ